MKLKGRACVVTGAARGIGLAVCRRLAREGCALTLWDIDADALEQSRKDLEKLGSPIFGHRCDITDKSEVYRLAGGCRGNGQGRHPGQQRRGAV